MLASLLMPLLPAGLTLGLPLAVADAAPDPDTVTPGVIGFAATALVATATILLLFDMNRRVRRARFRAEVLADIAAEQAAAADGTPGAALTAAAPSADDIASDDLTADGSTGTAPTVDGRPTA